MLIPDQIQADGQPAPGSVRPIHRADVHIIEPQGSELWLDVKIHTVNVDLDVSKELLREEMTKCRAYGQRDGYKPSSAGQRDDTCGTRSSLGRTAPRGPSHLQPHHLPQTATPCPDKALPIPSPKGPPAPSCGARSLAP